MYQEDSNGETSFEIIEKKAEELSLTDKSAPLTIIPPGAPTIPTASASGNLLSNVRPPSSLPSFITSLPPRPGVPESSHAPPPPTIMQPVPEAAVTIGAPPLRVVEHDPYHPTEFSAAIPPSKGVVTHTAVPQGVPVAAEGGGLMGWMKDAMSSGGILSKVAEKAKSSVDSMITTLDPQMKEFVYSGGDIDVLVASAQQEKISAVREAFQSVFGKATVGSIPAQSMKIAAQPVGFASGLTAAKERIDNLIQTQNFKDLPVVAVENFLLDIGGDTWYDLGVLLLEDRKRGVTLQTFTQMTPVPAEVVALAREDTPSDYPQKSSGYSITIGGLMARNLQVDPQEWHRTLTGVSRREMILLAARTLAHLYKKSLG